MSFAYRHDIDGLRAFAVISVVIFHIQEHWLPSGFLGVDMFFVISGFLISTQLLNQISSGTFSLTEFYRRRVKRIVPAMLFVVSITITLSLFWLLPEDAEKAAESAAFAVASMANVYFWLFQDTGYFAESSLELPLLHLWSLGVEEQFYVFWPLILIALSSLLKSVRIIIFTTAIAATSFFLGSYLYDFSATFTYYMLPTRAGELLVGSISAILLFQKRTKTFLQAKSISRFIWWSGVTLVAISFWYLNPGYTFPGAHAILPTVGLSLMLLGGSGYNGKAVKLLSLKPLVFFGTISSSLYLWHWPVMAFYRYANYEITPASGVMLFIFMTAISWLTYKFIEESFRHSTESAAKVFIKQLAVPSAIIIFACLAIMKTDGKLVRYIQPDYLPLLEEIKRNQTPAYKKKYVCQSSSINEEISRSKDCIVGVGEKVDAVLVGDSNASHFVGFLSEIAKESGVSFRNLEIGSCPTISKPKGTALPARVKDCEEGYPILSSLMDQHTHIIIGNSWSDYQKSNPNYLDTLFAEINPHITRGKRITFLLKVPVHDGYDRRCKQKQLSVKNMNCKVPDAPISESVFLTNKKIVEFASKHPNVDTIDISNLLCKNGMCSIYDENGLSQYYDRSHLNSESSHRLGKRWLSSKNTWRF